MKTDFSKLDGITQRLAQHKATVERLAKVNERHAALLALVPRFTEEQIAMRRSEKRQAMILLAFGAVVLVTFAACVLA